MLIINTVPPEPNISYNHINLCWPHVAPPRSVALSHRWHEYLSASHLAERDAPHGLLVEIPLEPAPPGDLLRGLAFLDVDMGDCYKKKSLYKLDCGCSCNGYFQYKSLPCWLLGAPTWKTSTKRIHPAAWKASFEHECVSKWENSHTPLNKK